MSAPLYTAQDNYPTSPMATFPPPLPNARVPLRVRCGVTMRLHLSTHGQVPAAWPSPKGHVQPHRNHLPRRRNPRRVVLHEHDELKVAEVVPELKVPSSAPVVEEESKEKESTEQTLVEAAQPVSKGHSEPHRSNLPRRRNVKRFIFHTDEDEDEPVASSSSLRSVAAAEVPLPDSPSAPDAYAPPPLADQSQLQLVLPAMGMAYVVDDTLAHLPGQTAEEAYTHVVSVRRGEATGIARSYESRCTYLRLTLPPLDPSSTRAGLGLTDAQLRAARDFLAELRPDPAAESGVRILIATPPEHPTDAMSILACYTAFVTGKEVDAVLRAIDTEEGFLSTWKGEVSEDEIEKVEKIARAWSYMSQIVNPGVAA